MPASPPPAGPPAVAAYAYSPPTEGDVRLAIARQVGPEAMEAVWARACEAVGARRHGAPLAHDELAPIAEHLGREDGVLRVVGRSFAIRIRTYLLLSAQATPPAAAASRAHAPG